MNIIVKSCWMIAVLGLIIACNGPNQKESSIPTKKVLIIDGQNNHYVWPKTTMMMRDYLEETGLFEVSIHRMDSVWLGVKYRESRPEAYTHFIKTYPLDSSAYAISHDPIKTSRFSIDFKQYDVILLNLGLASAQWPEDTRANFEQYIKDGGGLVIVHAANNAWGDWPEFNKMIGLGGWGDRDSTSGPYVYYNDSGMLEKTLAVERCGSHGPEFEFVVTTRAPDHPIMKGLPDKWLHTQDELYERLCGPFENATIIGTAYSDAVGNAPPWIPGSKAMGQHVPILMVIEYGQGRIFHTTLGHFDYSMECAGFITTLQRGTEWAATGTVTQEVPDDFPTENKSVSRKWMK